MIAAATRVARAPVLALESPHVVEPRRNCWRVDRADRFACIPDAADYFRLVRQALIAATETVFILGWDITAGIELVPDQPADDAPTRLDHLLVYIAKRRPRLRCYILIWDYGALYTLERDPFSKWRLGWRTPRGVRFGFDDHHPVGGCHHQKVVVVDDALAFSGSVDLTGHRWDTSAHRVDEPARVTPLGVSYGPYHEVQAMVSGPVATSLGVLARDRWQLLGVKRLPPIGNSARDLWPADVAPDLVRADVAISRTTPGSEERPAVRECEALFLDSIASARQSIYIESQYFTNDALGDALARRLSEPHGPEVVIVAPKDCHGWLERNTMGAFRDSVFRRLIAADAHKRLRLLYPCASRERDIPTFVHSKVMIVDDVLARVGSANCARRSMGMDTECDLTVDAGSSREARAGVLQIRDRLLADHLGLPVAQVSAGVRRAGSIGAFIDARRDADHTLLPIELPAEQVPPSPALRDAADPAEPMGFGPSLDDQLPAVDEIRKSTPLRVWALPSVVMIAVAVVALRAPLHVAVSGSGALWIGAAVVAVAISLLLPLEVLAVGCGLVFGAARGSVVGLIGAMAAAVLGYVAGRVIGPSGIKKWMSQRSYRSGRQLGARGVMGVIALRLTSVASTSAANLISGAAAVPFVRYIVGTTIALGVSVTALTSLGALLRSALLHPSFVTVSIAAGATILVMASAALLRPVLLVRQFGRSVASHRQRAEFG